MVVSYITTFKIIFNDINDIIGIHFIDDNFLISLRSKNINLFYEDEYDRIFFDIFNNSEDILLRKIYEIVSLINICTTKINETYVFDTKLLNILNDYFHNNITEEVLDNFIEGLEAINNITDDIHNDMIDYEEIKTRLENDIGYRITY